MCMVVQCVYVQWMERRLCCRHQVSAGEGLLTSLGASEGWTPPSGALQLSYEFGFVADGLRAAITSVTSDVPRADILLPRGMWRGDSTRWNIVLSLFQRSTSLRWRCQKA